MAQNNLSFHLADDTATTAFGELLATLLQPSDLVLLNGSLGAGKTALARSIIRRLVDDPALDVPSPSFALVQPYEIDQHHIIHADLYRLTDPREIDELGILDEPEAIVLVEWPERAPELSDKADIEIKIAIAKVGSGRDISVSFSAPDRDLLRQATDAGFNQLIC